jgi:hypothetical protein
MLHVCAAGDAAGGLTRPGCVTLSDVDKVWQLSLWVSDEEWHEGGSILLLRGRALHVLRDSIWYTTQYRVGNCLCT